MICVDRNRGRNFQSPPVLRPMSRSQNENMFKSTKTSSMKFSRFYFENSTNMSGNLAVVRHILFSYVLTLLCNIFDTAVHIFTDYIGKQKQKTQELNELNLPSHLNVIPTNHLCIDGRTG
jgi:hypothetical protein